MDDIIAFVSRNAPLIIAGASLLSFVIGLLIGLAIKSAKSAPGKTRSTTGRPQGELVELYVGNLPYDTNEGQLRKLVEKYGQVASARIIKNNANGKSKGFGFVEIVGQQEADDAVDALHSKDYKGRKIVVNEAKSRSKPRSSRR
jgi:RNA recognition motif-containing protein